MLLVVARESQSPAVLSLPQDRVTESGHFFRLLTGKTANAGRTSAGPVVRLDGLYDAAGQSRLVGLLTVERHLEPAHRERRHTKFSQEAKQVAQVI